MIADGWRLAIGTLTVVPVRPPRQVSPGTARWAMLLAPIAVLPVVAAVCLAAWVGDEVFEFSSLVVAVLALGVAALMTRAVHLDGLSDTADGLSASYDRERALEVMRRGDVGPSGVVALVLVLLVEAGALVSLVSDGPGLLLIGWSLVVSRAMLAGACVSSVRAARPEGLGHAVAGAVGWGALAASVVLMLGLGAVVSLLADLDWWAGPACFFVAAVVALLVVARSVSRLGGITGDVLGAVVELSFAGSLVAAAAVL